MEIVAHEFHTGDSFIGVEDDLSDGGPHGHVQVGPLANGSQKRLGRRATSSVASSCLQWKRQQKIAKILFVNFHYLWGPLDLSATSRTFLFRLRIGSFNQKYGSCDEETLLFDLHFESMLMPKFREAKY